MTSYVFGATRQKTKGIRRWKRGRYRLTWGGWVLAEAAEAAEYQSEGRIARLLHT